MSSFSGPQCCMHTLILHGLLKLTCGMNAFLSPQAGRTAMDFAKGEAVKLLKRWVTAVELVWCRVDVFAAKFWLRLRFVKRHFGLDDMKDLSLLEKRNLWRTACKWRDSNAREVESARRNVNYRWQCLLDSQQGLNRWKRGMRRKSVPRNTRKT